MSAGWCQRNWYLEIIYAGNTFSSSQPRITAACDIVSHYNKSLATPSPTTNLQTIIEFKSDDAQYESELLIMVPVTMILGLLFLIVVLYRSCSKTYVDWYRLIAIYIFVTLGVPLSIALGPKEGGFNRMIGFGILIHNLGEAFILNHVFWGNPSPKRNRYAAIGAIFYVWIVMGLIAFLRPLWLLFLLLMLQGSFFDWTLVGTFIYMGVNFKSQAKCKCCCACCQLNFGVFGIFGALTHIMSIQPLFFFMAQPDFVVGGAITVLFLMPTFILYIIFSTANPTSVPKIIESRGYAYLNLKLNRERNVLLRQIELKQKPMEYELKQRNINVDDAVADKKEDYGTGTTDKKEDGGDITDELAAAAAAASKGGNGGRVEIDIDANGKEKDNGGSIFDKIINIGLTNMDNGAHKKVLKIVGPFAALMCTANSLIVLFAPCYITPPDCGFT